MKNQIIKIMTLSLFTATMMAAPMLARAQDAAPDQTAPAKHKKHLVFHGNLTAVDTNAMTLTVSSRTFEITSDTKITKDGQPATLEDGVVGEMAAGSYKKTDDGKLTALTVHFGAKKKSSHSADNSTNSVGK